MMAWLLWKIDELFVQLQNKCMLELTYFFQNQKLGIFQSSLQKKYFNSRLELTSIIDCKILKITQNIYCHRKKNWIVDIFSFEVMPWMSDSFDRDIQSASESIQEDLIELNCNDEYPYKFKRTELTESDLSNATKTSLSKHVIWNG